MNPSLTILELAVLALGLALLLLDVADSFLLIRRMSVRIY